MYIGYVDPPTVLSIADVGVMIPLLALLGGIGTVAGPVIGGLILNTGESWLQGELASYPPGISVGILGILLILAARFFNQGIWGFAKETTTRFWSDLRRRRGG
jgi:branched-chain amino acid transport system permease protein